MTAALVKHGNPGSGTPTAGKKSPESIHPGFSCGDCVELPLVILNHLLDFIFRAKNYRHPLVQGPGLDTHDPFPAG